MWPTFKIFIALVVSVITILIFLDNNEFIVGQRKYIADLQKSLLLRVYHIPNMGPHLITKPAGKEDTGMQNVTHEKNLRINGSHTLAENIPVNTEKVKPASNDESWENQTSPTVKAGVIAATGNKIEASVELKRLVTKKADDTQMINDTKEHKNLLKGNDIQITTPNPSLKIPMPVNPHDFAYLINNKSLCPATEPLHHLIYFHSSPASAPLRMALRNGWAQNGLFSKYPSRVVFFMGRPKYEKPMQDIRMEAELYGDIVMDDYHDSYKNLTYKAIGALKWISTFCNKAKFVIKADQDVYVNRFRTIQLLTGPHVNKARFFICNHYTENTMPILRDPKKCYKWCVPKHILPHRTAYPQYCGGAFYVFTTDIIKELYHASLSTPYFYIDDVYLTGMLAKKVGRINYIDIGSGNLVLSSASRVKHAMHSKHATDHIMGIHDPYHRDPGYYWSDHLRRLSPNQVAMLGKEKYQYLLQHTPSTP